MPPDPKVLMNQSERLRDARAAAKAPMEFHVVQGGGHGDPDPEKAPPGTDLTIYYATPENHQLMIEFLKKNLKDAGLK